MKKEALLKGGLKPTQLTCPRLRTSHVAADSRIESCPIRVDVAAVTTSCLVARSDGEASSRCGAAKPPAVMTLTLSACNPPTYRTVPAISSVALMRVSDVVSWRNASRTGVNPQGPRLLLAIASTSAANLRAGVGADGADSSAASTRIVRSQTLHEGRSWRARTAQGGRYPQGGDPAGVRTDAADYSRLDGKV